MPRRVTVSVSSMPSLARRRRRGASARARRRASAAGQARGRGHPRPTRARRRCLTAGGRVRRGGRARCAPCDGYIAGREPRPSTSLIALRSALAPSITHSTPCSRSRPRATRLVSSSLATVAFSVEPSHSPSGMLDAVGGDPQRDHAAAALQLDPVEHQRRQAHVVQAAAHQRRAGARFVFATKSRLTEDFDVERAAASTSSPTGSRVRPKRRVETPASICSSTSRLSGSRVGEVLIGRKRHLALAVGAAHPRALDRNPPSAERDLAVLVAVADRGALGVVLALRADDLIDLGLHQLAQHAEPDTDAQREQTLLRRSDELAQRLLNARRQRQLPRRPQR